MLGTLTAPTLLGSCAGNEAGKATGLSFALNHFGVSENDMQKVLAAALEKGGDYADLFFEHSYRNNIGLQDGTVNRASSNIDFGMGVRVLAGDQTGYAYVENVTIDEMLKAARTAARIANGSAGKAPANLTEEPIQHNYYGVQTPWDELAVNAKTPYLQKLNDQIFALDKSLQLGKRKAEEGGVARANHHRGIAVVIAAGHKRNQNQLLLCQPVIGIFAQRVKRITVYILKTRLIGGLVVRNTHAVRIATAHVIFREVYGRAVFTACNSGLFYQLSVDFIQHVNLTGAFTAEDEIIQHGFCFRHNDAWAGIQQLLKVIGKDKLVQKNIHKAKPLSFTSSDSTVHSVLPCAIRTGHRAD